MNVRNRPLVWYVAAGYGLPAGIEAHILHYATEMRNHGFDTKVVIFKPFPAQEHRFLAELASRQIPIVSMSDISSVRLFIRRLLSFVPWFIASRSSGKASSFGGWSNGYEVLGNAKRTIRREKPDIVHIFGRLDREAWPLFDCDNTIYHEMMTGTVDPYWTEEDLSAFCEFADRVAFFFAPGRGVADNIRREFGIEREIETIFTMCPDERGGGEGATSCPRN